MGGTDERVRDAVRDATGLLRAGLQQAEHVRRHGLVFDPNDVTPVLAKLEAASPRA